MRVNRIIASIIAFALLGLAPLAFGPSQAAQAASADGTAARASAEKGKTRIGIKIVKKKGDLILKGFVHNNKGPVIVQKATKCNVKKKTCNWKFYDKVKVGKQKGAYATKVSAPRKGSWYWRSRIGGVHSDVWETYKRPA